MISLEKAGLMAECPVFGTWALRASGYNSLAQENGF